MPTPGPSESKDTYIPRCIKQLVDEGKDQQQAIAICESMWANKSLDPIQRFRYIMKELGAAEGSALSPEMLRGSPQEIAAEIEGKKREKE